MEQFVVSARKYRPTTFASVVGQHHITSTLKNAIERGQLAHAYLFCGPRGVGKTTCARIFAKAINCLNATGSEACNECDSCRSFNEGRSMNIHELDAASNNSVDDIRNLNEQVRIIPQTGRYSVFIIDEVHMLSTAAFNAFLKTLEEPPQHAIFILATTEKHKIIPTILSRCQIYDFNRIRVDDAVQYLKQIAASEGVTADDESLNLIAQKADGAMRDALSMFDKAVSFCGTTLTYQQTAQTLNVLDYDTYFTITEQLNEGRYIDALMLFDAILAKGFSGQTFMAGLNQHLRDLLMAQGPAVGLIDCTGTLVERYKAQAQLCSAQFLFGAISMLTDAENRLRNASNQRLLVELTLMKIAASGQKKNCDLSLLPAEQHPLPPLETAPKTAPQQSQTAQPQSVQPARPQVQPRVQQPAVQSVPPQSPQPAQPQTAVQSAAPASQSQPQPQQIEQPSQQTARPAMQNIRTEGTLLGRTTGSVLAGGSLSELMSRSKARPTADGATVQYIDPQSCQKMEAKRVEIIDALKSSHPRFSMIFDTVTFVENAICITAPTQTVVEDLRSMQSEITDIVAQKGGIEGVVAMRIELKEVEVKLRPVKLEERLAHIEAQTPLFAALCKKLDLEVD